MEALLRLSGLLTDEDAETSDLQTLEKKLAEKNAQIQRNRETSAESLPESIEEKSNTPTPQPPERTKDDKTAQPTSKNKKKDDEVEALSEAMCSLVTNNYGDTRYIGKANPKNKFDHY
jgi:sRNA-binding protein